MSSDQTQIPLQFVNFSSSVHPGFWSAISKVKLEVSKLDQGPIEVHGYYVNNSAKDLPASLHLEWDACDMATQVGSLCWNTFPAQGVVINFNTLEAFKSFDKTGYLDSVEGTFLWEAIQSGEATMRPDMLTRFIVLMYADLKKYNYYYWFAFPALSLPPELVLNGPAKTLADVYSGEICDSLSKAYFEWKKNNQLSSGYFAIRIKDEVIIESLESGISDESGEVVFGFSDPCTSQTFLGWPLRNLMALLAAKLDQSKFRSNGIKIIGLRQKSLQGGQISVTQSLVVNVCLAEGTEHGDGPLIKNQPKCVGFEKNESGVFAPKFVNMKASMDPRSLAESSVDLNLKLMKWRLVPNLDLGHISNTRCLLLGSGTLGCNVARCLLGWGVRNITFVDNSRVSYSNPVRQSLFSFEDCLDGGQHKAVAAAKALTAIFPGVKAEGIDLTIPLPAHPISDGLMVETRRNFEALDSLIQKHDVIFLLMDTRESRWLPTVMGCLYDKVVINAALGFDSYLVMRHGVRTGGSTGSDPNLIPGNRLGCYFCTDVVAPGNSTRDRTLDQQCTVTRPGVSYTAAGLAVELMASILQHPDGILAPASISSTSKVEEEEGLLGIVPHTIRGSLNNFQQILPTTPLFSNCTACSKPVIDQFATEKFEMFLKVANNGTYLEDLAGLSSLLADTKLEDVIECEDCDDF